MRSATRSAALALIVILAGCGTGLDPEGPGDGASGMGPAAAADEAAPGQGAAGDRPGRPAAHVSAAARRATDPEPVRRRARRHIEVGEPVPDFAFTDLDGVERRLSDYRGQVVLLDFWGIWCKPCVAEVPHLVDTYERFGGDGFEIVGVNYRDDTEKLRTFLDERGMRWVQTGEDAGADPIHELYSIRAWPSYYLIDERGDLLALNPRGERLTRVLEAHFGR